MAEILYAMKDKYLQLAANKPEDRLVAMLSKLLPYI